MAAIEAAPPAALAGEAGARSGLLAALAAYSLWGFLPLLFHFLQSVGAVAVVAERTVWSLVLVGAILLVGGRFGEVRTALSDPRTLRSMLVSSALLGGNWLLYVWAVESGQVLEASFGYFINPLVNVAIGMILLGEKQNFWQTVSIAIAATAIAIQAVGVGGVPYIALGLAVSFGFYGYFRKTANVGSLGGLFVETLLLLPLAGGYLIYSFITSGPGPHADPTLMTLLLLTGPASALPLLLFAFAVQRLRLTTIGMLQYIAPSIAFVLAITFFGEDLNPIRLLSFALIWLSLAVFTADSFSRRNAKAA